MATAIQVKEAVKETLIGSEEPVSMSAQTKTRFFQCATKDSETGELMMGPDEFINAVAPADEDYVSLAAVRNSLKDQLTDNALAQNSTRSSVSNTQSCSESPTAKGLARSTSPTGPTSRTF